MDEKSQSIIESTVDNILSEIAEGREIASDVLDETTRTTVLQAMSEGKAIQLTANAEVLGEEEIDAADLCIVQEYLSNITDTQHPTLQYSDFSFHLVSDDGALLGGIKQLKQPISYAVVLSEGTAQQDTSYYMMWLHNGNITKIPLHTNADRTMTFFTDQLSLHASVTEEKVGAGSEPIEKPKQPHEQPGEPKQPSTQPEHPITDAKQPFSTHEKTEKPVKKKVATVSTADMQNGALWLSAVALVVPLTTVVLRKKHKKGAE